jgi:ABC-type multidrug transport system ATPase subunit
MQPQVLVLDEPTSQLDPAGRWEVVEAIERLKHSGELTIVMTTHETEEILHLADQVLVLERGEAILRGPPGEVFSQTERLDQAGVKTPALVRLQTRLFGGATNGTEVEGAASLTVDAIAQRVCQAVQKGELRVVSSAAPTNFPRRTKQEHQGSSQPERLFSKHTMSLSGIPARHRLRH